MPQQNLYEFSFLGELLASSRPPNVKFTEVRPFCCNDQAKGESCDPDIPSCECPRVNEISAPLGANRRNNGGIKYYNEPLEVTICLGDWSLALASGIEADNLNTTEHEVWNDPIAQMTISRFSGGSETILRFKFGSRISIYAFLEKKIFSYACAGPSIPEFTISHLVADQVLPRILALEGKTVIHAGAISWKNQAVLVVGQSGRGKSSLVASLNRAGFPLLGDDALVASWQDDVPCAKAIYPSLRLLPDSLEAIFPARTLTMPFAHYSYKQRIDVPLTFDSDREPLPIAAVFALAEPATDGEIRICRISPAKTCMTIIANSFALDPTDKELALKKLADVARLTNAVPAFAISYPREYSRLPEVHAAIIEQVIAGSRSPKRAAPTSGVAPPSP